MVGAAGQIRGSALATWRFSKARTSSPLHGAGWPSKIPYLSVIQKAELLRWFRNYFDKKENIPKESPTKVPVEAHGNFYFHLLEMDI